MKINHSDANTTDVLDEASMSYMALLVHDLNAILKENGVKKSEVRQEICSSFLFRLAYNLDAGWFIEGSNKFFPKLGFATRSPPAEDENLGKIETLHVPTEASSLHEYAIGVVSEYFEDNDEEKPDISTGSYENAN